MTPSPRGRLYWRLIAAPTANLKVSLPFVGAGHWPAHRGASAIPEPTLIRLASLGTFPLEGGRLAGGASPSPTVFKKFFRVWVGEALGPPADHVPANTCSAKLGAEVKSQPLQFSTRSGPSGPEGEVESHSDFARRKYCKARQVRVLRNGVRGKRSYGHEVSIGRVPGDPLGTFPSLGKYLAAGAAKYPRANDTGKAARRGCRALRKKESTLVAKKTLPHPRTGKRPTNYSPLHRGSGSSVRPRR